MIKVGVIGLGMIGQMHLAAWAAVKGTRLRMVADTDPRRASGDLSGAWSNLEGGASAIDFSQVSGTTDPMELVHSDEIDVVELYHHFPGTLAATMRSQGMSGSGVSYASVCNRVVV